MLDRCCETDSNSTLISKLLISKTKNTYIQLFRYIFVGGTAAVADIGSLYLLTSIAGVHYLTSAAIAFLLGVLINYLLSIAWVFRSTGNLKREISLFIAVGVGGLLLNEVTIWFFVEVCSLFYMVAKLISTAMVMFWNFGMRKKFVFKG